VIIQFDTKIEGAITVDGVKYVTMPQKNHRICVCRECDLRDVCDSQLNDFCEITNTLAQPFKKAKA
jgi:hypothetical protein